MQIVLLSGGAGKRLWPLSNELYSKQFLRLLPLEDGSRESMIQRVCRQVRSAAPDVPITVATAQEQTSLIRRQLGTGVNISIEPCRRDTFPAIALVSAYLHEVSGVPLDEAVAICPADPYVDEGYFHAVLQLLKEAEQEGAANLVLMGVEPTYPSEKYGYIMPLSQEKQSKVQAFKEKPDKETAEKYIAQGALWNSGVFAFKLGYALDKARELLDYTDYEDLFNRYEELTRISFDYAVVEKESSIVVQRYSGTWLDIGTWNTLAEVMPENTIGRVMLDETCTNVHVVNTLPMPILCMGLKNVVVAASPEGILIADKKRSSAMKPYAERLHTPVMYAEKSWGEFRIIDAETESLTIKITLSPGRALTYHLHERRDETWTVIEGRGWVKLDGNEFAVAEGQTVRIPRGAFHTIRAETLLKVMEIQTGEDIDAEDKIVWSQSL
ncbi:mannose-1-phosphate guanylyltransferase [Selenomonas sp. oral taxon 126]|uniref:sugar phosphate nucleotidyltransferase n=1 Tax=Selenomonas sp. oral taxon 126 TaxID=712528 RepID=UPI0008079391|nr:sugar phosphate nucleotidyltransferase [Selenomonas sp. oral taxon 126]ANR69686.1 mannose-1-phosphate guanylyltransferase [Selenomonas sp. oral taxon 126]